MLSENNKRLNLWLALDNRFDYEAFSCVCREAGIITMTAFEFSQKAGMVATAMLMYPDLEPVEAYLKFIQEQQDVPTTPLIVNPVLQNHPPAPCGSCGGGRVL